MTRILALIDGSIYAQSVCDHAAWAATRAGAAVELLHVLGRREVSSAPIDLSGNLDIDNRDTLLSRAGPPGRAAGAARPAAGPA